VVEDVEPKMGSDHVEALNELI
jgi:hypothetical protein